MAYSTIAIIYNPNSTGSSEQLARAFARDLKKRLPRQKIEIIPTQRAGHAEQLAYDIARDSKRPLIISSSGDGGYHEVINGALRAQSEGFHPTTSLLPAGNANDHHRNLTSGDLVELIATNRSRRIDVLKITGTIDSKPFERYAHSYIGFGLTPDIGCELNRFRITFFNEAWIVLRALFAIRPVRLVIEGAAHSYDSIIFSNIDTMSKVLKISAPSTVTDGKFEVTIFRKRHKLQLIATLLRASLIAIKHDRRVSKFSLRTTRQASVQTDGEVFLLDPRSDVTITAEKQLLHCLL